MKLTGKLLAAALIPAVAATIILTSDGEKDAVNTDIETVAAGVELVELRTENAEVYTTDTPGKRVMRVYSRPVHYRDKETGRLEKYDFAERDVDASVKGDARRKHDKYIKIGNHGMGWMNGKKHDYRFNHESGYYVQYRLLTVQAGMVVETETNRDGVKQTYTMSDTTWTGRLRWTLETDATMTVNGAEVVYTDSTGAFLFRTSSPIAWDADGKDVPVTVTVQGDTLIYDADVRGVTWPVTVDPTTTVEATNDGHIAKNGTTVYADSRDVSAGSGSTTSVLSVGQFLGGDTKYYLRRSFLQFPMPDLSVYFAITAATLYLEGSADLSATDFEIYLLSSTYDGPVAADDFELFDGWQSSGAYTGTVLNSTWNSSSYSATWNAISFNTSGVDTLISASNDTLRIALISKEDYDNSAPTGAEYINFETSITSGKEPYISFTYTASTTAPTSFSLSATSTSSITASWTNEATYDSLLIMNSPENTGVVYADNPTDESKLVTGLSLNTLYTFFVRADSSGAKGDSNADSLYTLANPPISPVVSSPDTNQVAFTFGANSNPDSTMFAISVYNATDDSLYYWTGSALSGSETWKTRPAWTLPETITGLRKDKNYYIGVKAKNGDNVETTAVSCGIRTAELTQDSDPLTFHKFYTSMVTSAVYDSARVEQHADSIATAAAEKLGQSAAKMIARMTIDIPIPAFGPAFSGFQLHLRGKADYSTTDFLIRGSYGGWTSEQTSERYYTWPGYTQTMSPYGLFNQMWEDYNTSGFVIGDNVLVANSTGVGLVNQWKGTTAKLFLLSSRDISATSPSGNEYVEFHHESPDSSYAIYQYEYVEAVPYGVTATPLTTTSVTVTWNDSTLTNTGFLIVDGSTGVAYSDTLAHDAEADTLTGLTPNLLLSLKVKVVGGTMDGQLSSAVSTCTYPAAVVVAPDTLSIGHDWLKALLDTTGTGNPAVTEYALRFITSDGDTGWVDVTATPDSIKFETLGVDDDWGWKTYDDWGGASGDSIRALSPGSQYTAAWEARSQEY